jgi:hypothetical protein
MFAGEDIRSTRVLDEQCDIIGTSDGADDHHQDINTAGTRAINAINILMSDVFIYFFYYNFLSKIKS